MSPSAPQLLALLRRAPLGTEIVITAYGKSMEPVIYSSEEVVVRRASLKDIGIGDIVAFLPENGAHIVLHRVVRTGSILLTKGDNVSAKDPWRIGNKHVIGIAVRKIRGTKRVPLSPEKQPRAKKVLNKFLNILKIVARRAPIGLR